MTLEYRSPLVSRYSSEFMVKLFSEKQRASLFRLLWLELAQIEKQLGLPISEKAIKQMEEHLYTIDLQRIKELEEQTHHDVMAHILAFGEQAPEAKKIIHLGATSCYVTDNADVLIYKKALEHILVQYKTVILKLTQLCLSYKDMPCVGYTHFQVAQGVSMGKRFSLWLQDLWHLYLKLDQFTQRLKLLGIKGATGSQSSFYTLFEGDLDKINQMEHLFEQKLGLSSFSLSGQTYSRLQDAELLNIIAEIGSCFHKMGTDIRLLSHTGEVCESFESSQVGSSAMPHKKNPMLSERLCSLSRFLMQQPQGALQTHATQWLERSLDDSAIRRLIMPEAFLALDAVLNLASKVLNKLKVNKEVCSSIFKNSLLALSQEPILMYLSLKGHDRQAMHEHLKTKVHNYQGSFDEYLKSQEFGLDEAFIQNLKTPSFYIAPCAYQVERFINEHIKPFC